MSAAARYVSRSGAKLAAALDAFALPVAGLTCADLGSHTGGFVDCLLQRGATRVHAVDPGYGIFDGRLRRDARVVLHERTNALTFAAVEPCALVTIDVGWTPQRLILPAARRWLQPGGSVITLVKPHYEARADRLRRGVLPPEAHAAVLEQVRRDVAEQGWLTRGELESPVAGRGGNIEFLWLLSAQGVGL